MIIAMFPCRWYWLCLESLCDIKRKRIGQKDLIIDSVRRDKYNLNSRVGGDDLHILLTDKDGEIFRLVCDNKRSVQAYFFEDCYRESQVRVKYLEKSRIVLKMYKPPAKRQAKGFSDFVRDFREYF